MHAMFERIISEDIALETLPAADPLPVLVDAAQIEQVLVNLVTNARDAMPDGGRLVIGTGEARVDAEFAQAHLFEGPGRYAVLTVSDTGTGMDPRTMENVFEPFFTTKEVGKGTGLGLAMVYGVVKQHGGTIVLESEPGKGTTFRIYLQLAVTAAEASLSPDRTLPRGRGETVLVAEDDAAVRMVTRLTLEECGYRVLEAADGEEAVAVFLRHRDAIDLLLLDVIMPRMNGGAVCREIRRHRPAARALFMSGYSDDIISRKGVLAEGFDLISKPIDPGTLAVRVREALDR
jgi:CheY-like chemotaxis protein